MPQTDYWSEMRPKRLCIGTETVISGATKWDPLLSKQWWLDKGTHRGQRSGERGMQS
jgi:hypothetical protein